MIVSMYVAGQSEVGPMIERVVVNVSPADIEQGLHYSEAEDAVNLDPPYVTFEEAEFVKALRPLLPDLIEAGLLADDADRPPNAVSAEQQSVRAP